MKFWQLIPAALLCLLLPLHAAAADTCTLAALPVSVNCACTVTLEALDGVQSAEVSHEKGTAVVALAADVADADLKAAAEAKDYTVTGIDA